MAKQEGLTVQDRHGRSHLKVLGYTVGPDPTPNLPQNQEVIRSQEIYQNYKTKKDKWITKFEEANQFRNGVQWTDEEEKTLKLRGQFPITVNRMHPVIETGKALLTYHHPQFRSTAREDSDRRTAKIFSDAYSWVWYVSGGNEELKIAIDDYYVGGMGILHGCQDPHDDFGKGECKIFSGDPRDYFFDSNAKDRYCRDSAHILVVKNLTDEQSSRLYPEFWNIISKAMTIEEDHHPTTSMGRWGDQTFNEDLPNDAFHLKRRFIERYSKVKLSFFHIFEPTIFRFCASTVKQNFNTDTISFLHFYH